MSLSDQIDELCDAWAEQWQLQSCPDLGEFLAGTDSELVKAALPVLVPMDFQLRRTKHPLLQAREYAWLGDGAVEIAERCCNRSVLTDSSSVGQQPDSVSQNVPWTFDSDAVQSPRDACDDVQTPELREFPSLIGEYRVIELIGGGGQGVVAKAVHEKTGRDAAIKFIRPELAASLPVRRRFLREATIARSIRHPNVVQFLSVEEKPQLCIVMEFVTGKTLETHIREQGTLTVQQLLAIGIQVADGLQAVHSANIVHRDLKPLNILLEMSGPLVARISDFGVARFSGDPGITRSGTIVGSAAWLSPEQALEKPVSERSDLFSLGSILYCMACGQSPFLRSTLMATLNAIVQDAPVGVKLIRPDLPDEFCELLDALLAKNPDLRPASANDVSTQLRAIAGVPEVTPANDDSTMSANTQSPESPRKVGRRILLTAFGTAACACLIRASRSLWSAETSSRSADKSNPSDRREIASRATPAPLIIPSSHSEARARQNAWATYLGVPSEIDFGQDIRFTLVPPIQLSATQQLEVREELQRLTAVVDKGASEQSLADTKESMSRPFFAAISPLNWRQYRILRDGLLAGSLLTRLSLAGQVGIAERSEAEQFADVTWTEAMELQARLGQHVLLKERLRSLQRSSTKRMPFEVGLPKPIDWLILARVLPLEYAKKFTPVNIARDIQLVSQSAIVSGIRSEALATDELNIFGKGRMQAPIFGWIKAGSQKCEVAGSIETVADSQTVRCNWTADSASNETAAARFWPVIQISFSHLGH